MITRGESVAEVTAAEVARIAGVGRAAVSNWRRRHADFPTPVGGTPASPTFRLDEIESWLTAYGKLDRLAAEDRLWQELRAYTEDWGLVETLADVAAFLTFIDEDRPHWERLRAQPDATLAEQLPAAVTAHVGSIPLPGDTPFAAGLRPGQVPFWRSVAGVAEEQGVGSVFEELHGRYIDSSSGRGAAATTLDLAAMIAAMVPPVHEGAVFDPACGTGNLLYALGRKLGAGAVLAGQEIVPALARIAAFRLGQNVLPATIRQGDSLRDDQFRAQDGGDHSGGAALVVCDPPFGSKNWGHEELAYDSRWEFDLPSRADSELAWVQHCYAHLRPGGTAIVILPPSVAARRSGRRVRAEMLRQGALRQLIALPSGLASGHGLGVHLWILSRPGDGWQPVRSIRMVDGTRFDRDRLRRIEGDWWHQFRDEPGVTADVPVITLLDDEVDLSPSRHVQRTSEALPAHHAAALTALAPLLAALPEQLPKAMSVAGTPNRGPTVSVAELIRSGAVDLVLNRELSRTDVGGLRTGDVLVPALDPKEPPVVVTDERGEPAPDRHLLRCDPEVVDPYFLAGFLGAEANKRQAITGTGSFRYDVRRAQLPRLPLSEQRRYAAEFRRLAEFTRVLHRAAALGDDVVRLAMDGLTSGVFIPPPADPVTDRTNSRPRPTKGN
ncbi:N-6 DNA methylase [Micromonospora sp. L31]|uniref:N-6 DNA methylase n=1 Tax=Micromonospora sp. L31 TaxID=3452213 RepID=UPI003F895296